MAVTHTDALLLEAGLTDKDISLPLGNIAMFGQTGTGKSSMFFGSRYVQDIIIADMGSMAHKLYTPNARFVIVSPEGDHLICQAGKPDISVKMAPVDIVRKTTEECRAANRLFVLDSWSTLQEHEVAYTKKINNRRVMLFQHHYEVVGRLRDLALHLSATPGFSIFNTSSGGEGKTPEGKIVQYPKGCITGYPSLNGTEAGKETILARWSSVWGAFKGYGDIPRGLYVPNHDIRPNDMQSYSPLKDPYMVIRDTSDNEKHIMVTFDLRDPANNGRCFIDEMLVGISKKLKEVHGRQQGAASTSSTGSASANGSASQTQEHKKSERK